MIEQILGNITKIRLSNALLKSPFLLPLGIFSMTVLNNFVFKPSILSVGLSIVTGSIVLVKYSEIYQLFTRNPGFVSETNILLKPESIDPVFLRSVLLHEAIHYLTRVEKLFTDDITAAGYEMLRDAELMGINDLVSSKTELIKTKLQAFQYGIELIDNKDMSATERLQTAKQYAGFKSRDNIKRETPWTYKYGAVLGGIAYGLAQQTGNPDDAWRYLNLISQGTDSAKAENIVRGKQE